MVTGYKLDTQKLIAFLHINKMQLKDKTQGLKWWNLERSKALGSNCIIAK
jgi:hypothetical protein